MSDPLKNIDRLAAVARKESAPDTNVSRRVMASVRIREAELEESTSLNWFAGLSAVSALVMSAALVPIYQTWSDPFISMLVDLTWSV